MQECFFLWLSIRGQGDPFFLIYVGDLCRLCVFWCCVGISGYMAAIYVLDYTNYIIGVGGTFNLCAVWVLSEYMNVV